MKTDSTAGLCIPEKKRPAAGNLAGKVNDERPNSRDGALPLWLRVIQKMAYLKPTGLAPKTIQKYQNVFDRLQELANRRSVTKISRKFGFG